MTVTVNDRRIQYTATAGQTVFPYDFEISDQSDIVVLQNGIALTVTTDYTVSGVGNAAGGNITLTTGATVSDSIVIYGDEAIERDTDFSSTGNFLAATLDEQLDSIVRWGQQLDRDLGRAVKLKEEDTTSSLELPIAATRASKFLAFDGSGNAIAAAGSADTVVVSTFMATVLDDADASEARDTLGVGSNINTTNIDALTTAGGNLRTNGDTNCLSWGGGANLTAGGNLSMGTTHKIVNCADPSSAQDVATKAYVDSTASSLPSGMIAPFAMSTPPSGWLECDGSAVSRTTYADLFAAIGTTWGVGDGSTTFNLPDARGEFLRGWDNGKGTDSGRSFASSQDHAFENHHHVAPFATTSATTSGSIFGQADTSGTGGAGFRYQVDSSSRSDMVKTGDASYEGGYNTASETRPTNIAVMYCIKT